MKSAKIMFSVVLALVSVLHMTPYTNGMANVQVIKDQYGNTITTSSNYYSSYPHSYYSRSYAPRTYYNDPVFYYRSSDTSYYCDNCNTQIYKDAPSSGTGCSGACGINAVCREVGNRPVCSCPPGYKGSPLTRCNRDECLDHSECAGHLSCVNGACINPCTHSCGANANCEVRNHVPVCSCPKGYKGDPFSSCVLMDPAELCQPSPCGVNTRCEVVNGVPTCSCLPGFFGEPLQGCRHECETDGHCGPQEICENFKCTAACKQCGKGAECVRVSNHRAVCECPKNYIGNAYSECRAECYGDVDCPGSKPACIYGVCKNPCDGACGIGADCNLRGLTPICSCPRDMTGDPFVSCRPFTKEDLCIPNPCGTNAICTPGYDNTGKERPVCTCPAGYTGNSLVSCIRGECQNDNECPDHLACVGYKCSNPCLNQCGTGAQCNARRHLAVCTCPSGTVGDALISCRQSRAYPVSRYNYKRK